jgi:hypothetical protein
MPKDIHLARRISGREDYHYNMSKGIRVSAPTPWRASKK